MANTMFDSIIEKPTNGNRYLAGGVVIIALITAYGFWQAKEQQVEARSIALVDSLFTSEIAASPPRATEAVLLLDPGLRPQQELSVPVGAEPLVQEVKILSVVSLRAADMPEIRNATELSGQLKIGKESEGMRPFEVINLESNLDLSGMPSAGEFHQGKYSEAYGIHVPDVHGQREQLFSDDLRKWIRLATLALPTERVGTGARWQYAFSAMTEVQPSAMAQHRMDFELLSLTPKISVRLDYSCTTRSGPSISENHLRGTLSWSPAGGGVEGTLESKGQAQVYDRGRLIEASETGSIALMPQAQRP